MSLKVNGKKIRGLRNKRGWTQEELGSKEMDAKGVKKISTRTIQKIENDQTFLCSKKMIKNLANVFDVEMNELLNHKTEVVFNNSLWDPLEKQRDVDNRRINDSKTKPDEGEIFKPQLDFEKLERAEAENEKLSEEQLNRIFTIDEAMISASHDVYPDADVEDIWDYTDKLRKFKFIPISYVDLVNGLGETTSSKDFHNLLKMERLAEPDLYHPTPMPVSEEALSGNINKFFESISKANSYYIEPFIPKDESSTEIILKIIQNIEKFFKAEVDFSEEFKIKSTLGSLIEQLEEKKIGLFFNMSISRSEQFDEVHGYLRCWEANYIKIIIEEWSSRSVRSKNLLYDEKNRISLTSYKQGWREWTEVDPIHPDDQGKDDDLGRERF